MRASSALWRLRRASNGSANVVIMFSTPRAVLDDGPDTELHRAPSPTRFGIPIWSINSGKIRSLSLSSAAGDIRWIARSQVRHYHMSSLLLPALQDVD